MSHLSYFGHKTQAGLAAVTLGLLLAGCGAQPVADKGASPKADVSKTGAEKPGTPAGTTTSTATGTTATGTTATGTTATGIAAAGTPAIVTGEKPKFTKPDHVRGIYLTAWSAGSKTKMAKVYALLDHTVLNSVVIDVRDSGEMYWKTGIPLATQVHANDIAVSHADKTMADLAAHGVYPIARIACFRDHFVPKAMPSRGVQTPDGKVWRDRSGNSWLDPYNKANWEYIAQTVDYALSIGFPEIQLDYVRFPSEGKSKTQRFPGKDSYPDKNAKPEDVIAAFVTYIKDKVKAAGAVYSADIFGIISSSKSDQGIGQELEKVAAPFDLMSPMVYPSHFHAGEYKVKYPNAQPYDILIKSLGDYKKRLPGKVIRPWLQDFTIKVPGQPHVKYGVTEVRAQIKAAHEMGYDDYLMWNAANRYTEAAYAKPKS